MKLKITGLKELALLPEKIDKAVKKASKISLKKLAEMQANYISDGTKPNGGSQQDNSPETSKRKDALVAKGRMAYNKPLFKTGVLANASNWRVGAGKYKATLKPPKERNSVVYILKSKGYITVCHELPKSFPDILQKNIDEQLAKIEKKS